MRRRQILWLLSGSTLGLLASCQPAPASPPPSPAETPPPPPPPPATPTPAPTPPPSPTPVPPSPTPPPPPTPRPTATPTAATPPALAAAIDTAMQHGIDQGQFPGGVALVRLRNEVILHRAYGLSLKYRSRTQLAAEPIAARPDTLYDFASISKLFTLTCVLRLADAGRVDLDQPVARYLPAFAANDKADITVRQLLTHTSGLPDYLRLWDLEPTQEARLRRVLEVPLVAPPDTVLRYSDLGLITLGHLVEQVRGASLDRVVADLVTGPLGLQQVQYRPPAELKPRIAATEDESAVGRGLVWGEVHDENAWSLGGVAGHAGLFGPADELALLAQLYLDNGTAGGDRLLRAETVAEATRNQIGSLGARGLGWELDETYYMGRLASPQTYGHTGFTGTSLVVDPRRQLIVVLLTNRVHPTRDGPSNNPTRQAVADAALAAA